MRCRTSGRPPRRAPAPPSACPTCGANADASASARVEIGDVERHDERVLGPRDHARRGSTSERAPARGDGRADPRARRTASPSGSRTRRARPRRAPTGSINVAVPTCTAHAPASSISTASSPERTPPTARIGDVGHRARDLEDGARSSTASTPDPRASPSTGPERRGGASRRRRPSPADESISVRPCAPARTTARASSTISGVSDGSFAKTGTIDIRATAPTISARAGPHAPRGRIVRSSSSGSESGPRAPRSPGAPCSRLVSRTYSSRRVPAMDTITASRRGRRRGSSSAMKPSMPGFCIPVAHVMPGGRSRRSAGVGSPRRGRSVMLRVTSAPTRRVSIRPVSSRPVPAHPDATMTGVASDEPGQVDGDRAFHPGHERTTGSPSGGVGSIVGASESHRSHSTRAGLNTGPSMQDRRLS